MTLILSANRSRHRSSTRRLGTACGVAVGSLLYLPQLLQSLDPTRSASGGVGLFGDGPALLIPLFLGICRRLDRALGFGGDPHLPVGLCLRSAESEPLLETTHELHGLALPDLGHSYRSQLVGDGCRCVPCP